MSERWTRTVDPGGRDVLMRVNGSRGVEYLEWTHDGDLPQNADPLGKIAAALNAAPVAAQHEERDGRTEVHWTALRCSLEIAEHELKVRDELLREIIERIRGYCNGDDEYIPTRTCLGWLARFAALNKEEGDGG